MTGRLHRIDTLLGDGQGEPRELRRLTQDFREVVDTPAFPCVFSQLPFTTGDVYLGVVPTGVEQDEAVVDLLDELTAIITAAPDALAVVFVDDELPEPTLDDDFSLATSIVSRVMSRNRRDRPQTHDVSPDDPSWMLWLNDVGLFLNFSSPRHRARHSRNVGSRFTVIAQARASFDEHPRSSERVRAEIRRRVAAYDDVPVHPCLGRYGDSTSREALQFFLGDRTDAMDPTAGTAR